jgi:hypothetical protein
MEPACVTGLYNAPGEWPWTSMFLVVLQVIFFDQPAWAQPWHRCACMAA